MQKLSEFIVKNKVWIVAIAAILSVLAAVGTYFVIFGGKINSDMLVYLPEGTDTADGITFLKENFGVEGDAFVVVEGTEDDKELAASIKKMKNEIEGITTFMWYGDVQSVDSLVNSLMGKAFRLDEQIDTSEIKEYLRRPIYDDDNNVVGYNYILLVLFDYSPSTQEAFNVHKQIRAELNGNLGRSVAISGMTALADTVMTETLAEVPYYLIFAVVVVLIILFLSTDSFLDPILLMLTLGIAVLINMGTNYLLPDVSIISFAASSVLQLGITMDYAIFLLHTYREERAKNDPSVAVTKALPRTIINVLCGGLTTMGGFAALYFMEFSIGADLANVIIKGVAMSLVTVVFLQPCFLIYFDKALKKTTHKKLELNLEPMAKKIIKARHVIAIVTLLLLIPAFFGQAYVQFSYLKIYDKPAEQTAQEALAAQLQNQVIIAVPLKTASGSHGEFMEELLSDDKIDSVIGAYSVVKMEEEDFEAIVESGIFEGNDLFGALFVDVDGETYTLYLVEIVGDTEDAAAFATHKHLTDALKQYFSESYPMGVLTGVADMAGVTPSDFLRVTLISIGIIMAVMCVLLKSIRKSVMTVALIELAIWVNISINTIFSQPLNFMIYIIISSVQLGCTVDYAILLTTRFEETKKVFTDPKEAIVKAVNSAFPAITTSASIIIAVCLAILFVSNNLLVKEMAMLMSRGAFISYLMVLFALPSLLVFFDKMKPLFPHPLPGFKGRGISGNGVKKPCQTEEKIVE